MQPSRRALRRGARDDAEKPFWISFADLMTALMVLFLVALSVALTDSNRQRLAADLRRDEAVGDQREHELERQRLERVNTDLTRRESDLDRLRQQRHAQIESVLDEIDKAARRREGVRLDRRRHVIDFGARAQFRQNRHDMSAEQANAVRQIVPELLAVQRAPLGQRWLKRVVIEGFTDQTGSYLFNLNLSLQRSQRVLCVLLADSWAQAGGDAHAPGETPPPVPHPAIALHPVSPEDQALIKRLFLVGGYSANSAKASQEESRRIELRFEFYQLDEARENSEPQELETGRCAIGGRG